MSIHLPKLSLKPVSPFHQHEPEESPGKSRVSLVGSCCESDQEALFYIILFLFISNTTSHVLLQAY